MNSDNSDTGIILAIIQRFEHQRLPRMMELKQKLDAGESLNDFDIEFLSETLHDSKLMLPYLDRMSEFEPLFAMVMHYY